MRLCGLFSARTDGEAKRCTGPEQCRISRTHFRRFPWMPPVPVPAPDRAGRVRVRIVYYPRLLTPSGGSSGKRIYSIPPNTEPNLGLVSLKLACALS